MKPEIAEQLTLLTHYLQCDILDVERRAYFVETEIKAFDTAANLRRRAERLRGYMAAVKETLEEHEKKTTPKPAP